MILSNAQPSPLFVADTLAAEQIANRLSIHLKKGNSVLWLISGGSSIDLAVQIQASLGNQDTSKLTVALVDERYVQTTSSNSNIKKLLDAGFNQESSQLIPILQPGLSLEETLSTYNQALTSLLKESDYSLGIFGMGADGHTAGILPGSPLVNESTEVVGSYKAKDFVRISLTPFGITQLNSVVLYVTGKEKWPQLSKLNQQVDPNEMPVQLLKQSTSLTVYTDYKGDTT